MSTQTKTTSASAADDHDDANQRRPTTTTTTTTTRDDHKMRCATGKRCARKKVCTDFSIDAIIGPPQTQAHKVKQEPNCDSRLAPVNSNTRSGGHASAAMSARAPATSAACASKPTSGGDEDAIAAAAADADNNKQHVVKKYRPKNFQCPACKMAFSNNGQLKNHVRIHTGERPFVCDINNCNKTFTRNEELTRHKLIHTGIRPHACTHCGKRFGRKDHLKKHVRTHERKKLRKRVFVPAAAAAAAAAAVAAATSQSHRVAAIDSFVFASQQKPFGSNKRAFQVANLDKHAPVRVGAPVAVHRQTAAAAAAESQPYSSSFARPPISFPLSLQPPPPFAPTLGSTSLAALPPLMLPPLSTTHSVDPSTIRRAAAAAAAVRFAAAAAVATTTAGASMVLPAPARPTTAQPPPPQPPPTRPTNMQLLANDYWNKWYDILGYYQQKQHPSTRDLDNLFR